jgi:hypothetical protein
MSTKFRGPSVLSDGSRPQPSTDAAAWEAGYVKLVKTSDASVIYKPAALAHEIAAHPDSGYAVERWPTAWGQPGVR